MAPVRCCIAAVLTLLCLVPACRPKSDGVITLRFWAMGVEGENVQKLMPEFERRNPGIRVIVQQIPWMAAHEKLLTAFAGSSTPDICQLGNTWIPEFSALNALAPMNAYAARSAVVIPDRFFPGIWDMNVIDSSLVGVPWYVDTRLLFYRKDILAEAGFPTAPRTWEEWQRACARIVATAHGKKRYGVFLPLNEWQPAVILGLESGSNLLKDRGTRGDFSGGEFAHAFDFLRSFYAKGYAPTSLTDVLNIYQSFEEGYFAMYITGPWNVGEFSKRLSPAMSKLWMTAPMPSMTGGEAGASLPGGSSLVIFRSCEHPEAAWKLVEYLAEPAVQVEFYRLVGNLPARREAWEDASLAGNPLMHAFYVQLQHVRSTPKVPQWEQMAMKLQKFVETAATGDVPTRDLLRTFDGEVDKILEKRRWLVERGVRQ